MNALTGETIEREMTDEEQSARNAFLAEIAAEEATAKAIADQAAIDKTALLAKLGISQDDLKTLLN